ncbi:MAG: Lrp/AsnC family transcriptional regulator [Acidimicrobiales bacterium]
MSPTPAPQRRRPVDATDRAIIEHLVTDGRLAVNELAKRCGLSRATTYQRLGRLLRDGVITGFSARTDHRRLGLDVSALIIVNAEQRSWRSLLGELRELPSVEWVTLTAGGFDFVLLVRTPDVETLRDVVLESLQSIPGVRSTQTMFILDEVDLRARAAAASR